MANTIEYALMAGSVYASTRNVINQIPSPKGWNTGNYRSLPDGFEAVSFQQPESVFRAPKYRITI